MQEGGRLMADEIKQLDLFGEEVRRIDKKENKTKWK